MLPHTMGITFTLLLSPHSSSSCCSIPVQPPFSPTGYHTTSICLSCIPDEGTLGCFLISMLDDCYLVISFLSKTPFQHLDFCGIRTHSLRVSRRSEDLSHFTTGLLHFSSTFRRPIAFYQLLRWFQQRHTNVKQKISQKSLLKEIL